MNKYWDMFEKKDFKKYIYFKGNWRKCWEDLVTIYKHLSLEEEKAYWDIIVAIAGHIKASASKHQALSISF